MTVYKISFETVKRSKLSFYCNADPAFYKNTRQVVPNSQIPNEDWHLITRETDDPWDQYRTLKQWDAEDKEFVRCIKLEQMVSEPQWKEVEAFVCSKCLMISFNSNDVKNGYCGNCHEYIVSTEKKSDD